MGIEALYRRPRTTKPSRATRSIRICGAEWRSFARTRSGRWTSPTSRWRVASCISRRRTPLGDPPGFVVAAGTSRRGREVDRNRAGDRSIPVPLRPPPPRQAAIRCKGRPPMVPSETLTPLLPRLADDRGRGHAVWVGSAAPKYDSQQVDDITSAELAHDIFAMKFHSPRTDVQVAPRFLA